MKKTIITTLLTLTAALGFAEEPALIQQQLPTTTDVLRVPPNTQIEISSKRDWFLYVKMIAADSYPEKVADFIPGFGLGFRFAQGNHGLDISSTGVRGHGWSKGTRNYFWSFPKASYLYYFSPAQQQSFYAGGGLAWGGIDTKDGTSFLGISSNAVLGLEMFRKAAFRTFVELNVNQPTIARSATGPFPGPVAEISVGAGF